MKKLKRSTLFLAICFSALLVAGCDGGKDEVFIRYELDNLCGSDTTEARSVFILSCIKNANPSSDEEPEDWIRQCQYMAEDTYCPKESVKITSIKPVGGYLRVSKIERVVN